jgi:DNA ligase-1
MRTAADPKDDLPLKLPTLYKKDARSGVVAWTIQVIPDGEHAIVRKEWGKIGGKQQTADDVVKEGKRTGTSAATSAHGQAILEAKAEWEKQQARGGYGTDPEGNESAAKRSISPMLAYSFADYKDKLKAGPMFLQPKLDGHRCLAHIRADSITLKSRKGEDIITMPHIVDALKDIQRKLVESGYSYAILDGELFTLSVKFQTIASVIAKKKATPEEAAKRETIQYFIYDVFVPEQQNWLYDVRLALFCQWLKGYNANMTLSPVHTVACSNVSHVENCAAECVQAGYEGGILRLNSPYEAGKRSKSLLKVKSFDDGEFKVIGVHAGEGTFSEFAMFVLELPNNLTTTVTSPGTHEEKRAYLANPESVIGKLLTVEYFGQTDDGKLRFPTAKAFRQD